MRIGLTGASGQLAATALRYLLDRVSPSDVVAITRDPSKIAGLGQRGVQLRPGDFNEPSGLATAFDGVERLLIIPTPDLFPGVRPRQHTAAIDAAVAVGVRHIIYISTVGAHPGASDGLPESHFATEQRVIGTSASWNILRMALYAETLIDAAKRARSNGTYVAPAGAPVAYVTRDDIATAAAALLLGKGRDGFTYHATGPEALTQVQVAEIFSRVLGSRIAFTPQTIEEYEAGLKAAGLPPPLLDVLLRFQADVAHGAFDLVTRDVERLSGKPAESAADFLARSLASAGN
jgi:NAD(P)H dehydrogenase (quinone)